MNSSDKNYTEKLVHGVEKTTLLYNPKTPAYKDRFMVELEWREVAEIIGGTGKLCNKNGFQIFNVGIHMLLHLLSAKS